MIGLQIHNCSGLIDDELRSSRPVIGEAEGEIPSVYLP